MRQLLLLCFAFIVSITVVRCKVQQKAVASKGVAITTRQQWGAITPVLPMRTHTIQQITIHHTAVKQAPQRTLTEKLKGLQQFSMNRSEMASGRIKEAWADIPYHYYIAADGAIGEGRPIQYVGDSNTPYDPSGHALIVLEGNFENEEVTTQQYESLKQLIRFIARSHHIPADKISGHKDHAETACPGSKLYALIPALKQELAVGL